MSVTTYQPPAALYREEQWFPVWTYVVLLFLMLTGFFLLVAPPDSIRAAGWPVRIRTAEAPIVLLLNFGLPMLLMFGVLKMTTLVTPTECRVSFGWIPTYRRLIPLDQIRGVEVVHYRPWIDCGGWGIRRMRDGTRVLNARGNRAVRIILNDGTRYLIGSQRPEELAMALAPRD
jgi:hypothetical protein